MYQLLHSIYLSAIVCGISFSHINARTRKKTPQVKEELVQATKNDDTQKTVTINYDNTDLGTIINQLATLKQVNILLPMTNRDKRKSHFCA